MVKVNSYTEILMDIKAIKENSTGYITNFYPEVDKVNVLIANGQIYKKTIRNTLFILNKKTEFFHLFYCSSSIQSLEDSILSLKSFCLNTHLVVDIIGKENVRPIVLMFKKNGFYLYTTLNRMSRVSDVNESDKQSSPLLKKAQMLDSKAIFNLFEDYFNPIAEQIPTENEIINWIKLEHLIIVPGKEQIQGFVIFDLIGVTSYLRYWFVHPEYRNRKIGSILLNEYFKNSSRTKRQIFWVIKSNENAISRYLHYGFLSENLNDYIMTNKNIQYETTNN